jgi:glycerophosphoryl diester phosphodiesterase
MSVPRPAIAAHRGGAMEAVENSRCAFRYAAGLGVEQVEFDVHRTADGALVVLHDATLERTTTGRGPVGALRLDELRSLRLRDAPAETVPTLEEVLELLAPTPIGLRIEIKPGPGLARYAGIEAQLVEALRRFGLLERTVVTSFLLPVLVDAARAGAPSRLWLVAPLVQASLGTAEALARHAREAEVGELGLHIDHLDATWVTALRTAGLEVGAWAAHEDDQIDKALALDLAVFTTDRPKAALALRAARLASRPADR